MSWGRALWDARGQLGQSTTDRLARVRYAGAGNVTLTGFNAPSSGAVLLFYPDGRYAEDYAYWNNTTKYLTAPGSGLTFVVLEY